MADKSAGIDFFAGFIVGALAGAAAALLFAPQSGEETRAMIHDKGIEIQERSVEMSEEARRRAEELQTQAKEKAEAVSAQTRERAAELQTRMTQAVAEGKTAATQTKEDMLSELGQPATDEETPAEA